MCPKPARWVEYKVDPVSTQFTQAAFHLNTKVVDKSL